MKHIAVQVTSEEKAQLLVELLSSLNFVERVNIEDAKEPVANGVAANGISTKGGFPTPAVSIEQPAMLSEQAALDAMMSTLLAKYRGEYVAVFQGEVVDHDHDKLVLIQRIDDSHPNNVVLIREVTTRAKPPLEYRSIRFARE